MLPIRIKIIISIEDICESDWSIKKIEVEADAGAEAEGAKCENHSAVHGTKCESHTEDTPEEQKSVSSSWLAIIW